MAKSLQHKKCPGGQKQAPASVSKLIQDFDKARQKRIYHLRKQLHQALKKARQFEVRKIVRRLKEAKREKEGAGIGACIAGKLQQQLEAARGINISNLAVEVAAAYEGSSGAPVHEEVSPTAAVVRARVTAAKCVQQAVAAARAELAQLAANADDARREPAESESSGASGEALPMESSSGTEAMQEDAKALGRQPDVSSADEDVPEPSSSSGEGTETEDEEETAKRRRLLGGMQQAVGGIAKPRLQPKKKKNRLGQRARKRLAGVLQHSPAQRSPAQGPGRPLQQRPPVKPQTQPKPALRKPQPQVDSAKHQPLKPVGVEHRQEKLHPSWLAKKALADKTASLAKPQGRKVVFADED